ncbi:hypothetical protein CkaCkLH20_11806 [Colletotrichum karsti]|uniref:Uncharacterized protein n=1 Tax=Colletotrichum karsti TaxID=1095194 RepID=A0A9P6LD36_9PEZI|nr:uncharacterized protein CkaCkLH20_11806 [Colletotrichum karsti]KAF9870704.1 hypothetical protein CkaCkLH20_11806 [Colletotrichum karsti]
MAPKTPASPLDDRRHDGSHLDRNLQDALYPLASGPCVRSPESNTILRPPPPPRFLRRDRPRPPPITIPAPQVTEDEEESLVTAVPPTPPPTPSPGLPTPLLAGCPGREISGAKSDGREWAYDWDSPPVLLYPDDLSKTEFHEHPLARHIELEKGWEKHQLAMYGLILPAKVDNGTPTYTWESDDEEEEDLTKAVILATPAKMPHYPKLPPAPDTPVDRPRTPSNILKKVKTFANFVANNDMEKDTPELPSLKELIDQFGMPPGTPTEPVPRSFLRPTRSSGSLRPKTPIRSVPSATKLRNKRSATGISKLQISEPVAPEEMRRIGQDFSEAASRTARSRTRTASESERISSYATSLRSPSNLISPSISSNLPLYLLQPQHPTVYFGTNEPPPKFRLARPRLAPMEYARQYLLAKAKAEKQGEECTVQKPELTWYWSENYKEFFLLPSLPKGVTRNFLPDVEETDPAWKKKKKPVAATRDLDEEAAKRRSFIPLPLNLAPSSPLLPAHLRNSSHSSVISSTHKRDSSLNDFKLDQPRAVPADQTLLQSTKALVADPTASIPRENTDFFVAVHTSSESEFTSSFPPQFLSSSSLGSNRTRRESTQQYSPLVASERASSASPLTRAFTATLAESQTGPEQLTFNSADLSNVPPDFPFARPPSVASSQRTVTPALFTSQQTQAVPPASPDQVSLDDDAHSEVTAVYRPGSALSSCTVIRPCSPAPAAATDLDENGVSPNSIDYEDSNLPPAPVSPLSSSPSSPQTDAFATLQNTRTHDRWDDAQTRQQQQPCDETVVQSIADDAGGMDFADTSSVYSQDSVLTAIHRPAASRHNTPLDFMPLTRSVDEREEDLTPRQLREPSSAEAQTQARTLHHSSILQPVSYIPNTQVAQTYTANEASQISQNTRRSQASILTSGSSNRSRRMPAQDARSSRTYDPYMEANTRGARNVERQQVGSASVTNSDARRFEEMQARIKPRSTHETASIASVASSSTSQHDRFSTISDAPSITSSSTIESRRSQALSFTSIASSDRSTTSKPRRSRADNPQDAVPVPSLPRDPRFTALNPVLESPIPSTGLRSSATSPVVSSSTRARKSTIPNRRDSSTQQSTAADAELPSLKVRRRREVADLAQIPASQAYPQPLRFNAMKSPPPTGTTTTIVRSTSRLITDIGNELNREMEDVLSPRSASLVPPPPQDDSPDDNARDVETPTRRPPPRKVRSSRSMRFEAPSMPAPNKPLPSLPPQKIRRSEAPGPVASSTFVDVDFGPGPAIAHSQPPARVSSVPRPPIPTTIPVIAPPVPPSPSTGSEFVTRADFSVKKDRTVRPAASVAAFPSYRPTAPTIEPPRQVRRLESAANLQSPRSPVPPMPPLPQQQQAPASARTRLLGKMASMAELKHRKEAGSRGSGGSGEEGAVGMRTFLGEDVSGESSRSGSSGGLAPPPSKEGSKKKFFGGLFRRKKDGEK